MALAILVWFLAAMSLLVGGIVMQARVDVKLAQLHSNRARVEAAADGAIQLALAGMMQSEQLGDLGEEEVDYRVQTVGDLVVQVNFSPLTGLIDINMAPEGLLAMLFASVEGFEEDAARELSLSVVEWRSPDMGMDADTGGYSGGSASSSGNADTGASGDQENGAGQHHGRFESIEDLLLVPGMDRRIFEVVREAVAVSPSGQAGVDWLTAPVPVLRALGGIDEVSAMELAQARDEASAEGMLAPPDIDLGFQEANATPFVRVDATVSLDNNVYLRRRWVNRAQPGEDGLPWRYFRSEPVRVIAQTEIHGMAIEETMNAGG